MLNSLGTGNSVPSTPASQSTTPAGAPDSTGPISGEGPLPQGGQPPPSGGSPPPVGGGGGSPKGPPSGTTDYRGSDPIGSDTKGSDTRGSDPIGSDTKGNGGGGSKTPAAPQGIQSILKSASINLLNGGIMKRHRYSDFTIAPK